MIPSNDTGAEWVQKFKNPDIDSWIEDVAAVPLLVAYVPPEHRTLDVFIVGVMSLKGYDTIAYFSPEQAIPLLQQLRIEQPDLFPKLFITIEDCMAFYAKNCFDKGACWPEKKMRFYVAEVLMREAPIEAVAECVDDVQRARAFRHLFGGDDAVKAIRPKYRRYLLEDDLSL
jgi:hypothetical protein